MKSLGYIGAFLGGAIAGAALGILMAPEKGEDTRVKITDAVEDFLKKHNIKLSRKEVVDLVDDIEDDKNVETFAQLIESFKHYLGLQAEYVKLDVIDKVARLITAAALAFIFCFLLITVVLFASFAFAFWLENFIGMGWSFIIVTALHLLGFYLVIHYRKSWIEKPIVHFLAEVLLSK